MSMSGPMSAVPEHNSRRRPMPRLAAASSPALGRPEEPVTTTVDDVAALGARLRACVQTAVRMPEETLDVVLATLLGGGHLLVEDHPGVGKTTLARTLASSLDGRFSRVQATVDLLPADVLGTSIWRSETAGFEFLPGPVFANVVLVDELNRATPKTQSGLLEAMQERQVTVDGQSRPIQAPFIVIATQNPTAGYDGTYPLPPAQLDRFMTRVSLGYPTADQEVSLLRGGEGRAVAPVSHPARLLAAQETVAGVYASDALLRYVVRLLEVTRRHPLAEVGASPRAGVLLLAAARARAALARRDYAVPDDVQALVEPVLAHRIQPAAASGPGGEARVIADAVAQVPAR
ncbi:MAG: ATPase associated with various cellular 3 [Solirubrobacterales bacterium]|nr:ATPase associated with various cellular 3 [Solirubrobacterales bacterium]